MNPLTWIGNVFRWLAGLVAPMFVRPTLTPGLLWTLHILLVAGVTVGLWFFQRHYAITINIGGPVWLRGYWLPILFLLVYLLAWQAWWVWKLLQPAEEAARYPDIADAWAQIQEALAKAGIGLGDTPLFLVVGSFRKGLETLFHAIPRGLAVEGIPGGGPVRAYASRDAIYLTLPGVTLMGMGKPTVEGSEPARGGAANFGDSIAMNQSIGMEASIGMEPSLGASQGGNFFKLLQELIRKARKEGREIGDEEMRILRQMAGPAPGAESSSSAAPSDGDAAVPGRVRSVLQDPVIVSERSDRLQFLCELVARARFPLCPINGTIVAVSLDVTERDEVAQQVGLIAQYDLGVLQDALKLRFPVYMLFGDLELLPGGSEFLNRFAPERGTQRLGKGFPLNPDLSPQSLADAMEAGVNYVLGSVVPYWGFRQFKLETPNVETPAEAARANGELFRFLVEVKKRAPHAGRLVSRAMMPRDDRAPLYGGAYLTATSPDSSEPLFADEFFRKAQSTQGFVAWTEEAFAADATYRRKALLGYVLLAAVLLGSAALAAYVWFIRPQPT